MSISPPPKAHAKTLPASPGALMIACLLLLAGTSLGCPPHDKANMERDAEAEPAGKNTEEEPGDDAPIPSETSETYGTLEVDLLFVIDNSAMLDQPYLEYEPNDLFEDTGVAFSCISCATTPYSRSFT